MVKFIVWENIQPLGTGLGRWASWMIGMWCPKKDFWNNNRVGGIIYTFCISLIGRELRFHSGNENLMFQSIE